MKEEAMKDYDVNLPNFRLISAAFFGLLAVIVTIFFDSFLFAMGVTAFLPIFKSVLLAAVVAGLFGALFAGKIYHCHKGHNRCIFGWGFIMAIVGLPFYTLGLVVLMYLDNPEAYVDSTLYMLLHIYFFSFAGIFFLAGLWMAIIAGFLAIYLRNRLTHDISHSQNITRELPVEKQTKMHRSTTPHRHR